jgi:excisionase family DNA binding protein
MLGISRTSFYKLVKDGELSLRKIGRRSVILTTDLNSFIEGLSADDTEEARHDH